jgi:hypothetical protein
MPSPNFPILQQLDRLNESLSGFHDQLRDLLYGEEYKQCVPNLQGDDLVWLVDYLDKVLTALPFLALHLSQYRLSMALILPAPLPGSAYMNS